MKNASVKDGDGYGQPVLMSGSPGLYLSLSAEFIIIQTPSDKKILVS